MTRSTLRASLPALLTLLTACGGGGSEEESSLVIVDGPPPEAGRIEVLATDAPLDPGLVESALLRIDRVEIHRVLEGDEEWVSLYEGEPFGILVSELRNGVTQGLVDRELEAGDYDQLRLRVVDSSLELTNGNAYSAAEGTLHLGSLDTSGLKLHFVQPLEVRGGLTSQLLLDFDLSKMFKPVPASDPLAAERFLLHPGVRVANLSETGELGGTVVEDDGSGTLVGSDMATVWLLPPGETDVDASIAATTSEDDGRFAFLGVEPGIYDLIATRDLPSGATLTGDVLGVEVLAANATTVEILVD